MKDMGKLLKQARLDRGMSMREVAQRSGVPVSTISKLESGALDNPTFMTIVMLAPVLELEPQEWFDNPPKRRKRK